MKKKNFKRWTDAIWTTILSGAIGLLFYFTFGKVIFEMFVSSTNESDILTYYYSIENSSSERVGSDENIVLFDISGEKSRLAIAQAIKKISDCTPQKIGIDVIFSQASETDYSVDSMLEATIASLPNVVMASRIVKGNDGQYGIEHSFFTVNRQLKHGAANMDNLCTYTPKYGVNGTEITSFSAETTGVIPTNKRIAVNFSNKQFTTVHISEDIVEEDFNGKIVLVGDLNDLRDTHDTGFPISGSRRISGTVLAAYAVSSLINDTWIVKIPNWMNIVMGILTTFLFTVLCYWIKDKWRLGDLAERIIQMVQFIVLTLIGYVVFTASAMSINLIYAMIGVALMGISIDLLDWIKKKIGCEKE